MTEVRYNNQGGTLGASLTNNGTTITFTAAPNFATLTGGQTITLVLDAGTSNMEIVYLTAYTAAATTGTIQRAAEDGTLWPAVTHASGTGTWVCSATINDFNGLAPLASPTFTGTPAAPTAAAGTSTTQLATTAFVASLSQFGDGLLGAGQDGAVTLDGTNTYAFLSKSGNNYTATRDLFLTNCTINSGVTLLPNGYRILGNGTLTINSGGAITCNGGNASGLTAGTAGPTASLLGGSAGGNGATGNGSAGTAVSSNAFGGAGGAGGTGSATTGGAAGGVTAPNAFAGGLQLPQSLPVATVGMGFSSGSSQPIKGGAGGGGGGGDSTNAGGGGGGGGGTLLVAFKVVVNNGTLTANGGNGANGVAGNAGGGGAGGGGCVILSSTSITGAGTVTAAAGTVGTGVGTGANGAAGAAGHTFQNAFT